MLKVLFLPPTLGSSEPAPSAFSVLGLGYMFQVSAWGNSCFLTHLSQSGQGGLIFIVLPSLPPGAELQTFATKPHWPDQFGKINPQKWIMKFTTEFSVVCFGFLFF